jgi:superfamily II DNA/RNA helicase
MQDIFQFHDDIIDNFALFSRSFTRIQAADLRGLVDAEYGRGRYWPSALIQINPNYQKAAAVDGLVRAGGLHPRCAEIFPGLRLFRHQQEALAIARRREPYIVTTGTGSGKSLAFFLPIIDHVIRAKEKDSAPRTRAVIIYPMNALANSQTEELTRYLEHTPGTAPFTFARYTGQEDSDERKRICDNPPDILLTNYMMMELLLTRNGKHDAPVIDHCEGLEFLVLDELHTYRGRQGADVALLVRRLRKRLHAENLVCIGTSATMSSGAEGRAVAEKKAVAEFAGNLFGQTVKSENIITETLERTTDASIQINDCLGGLHDRIVANAPITNITRDPLAIWIELNMGIKYEGAVDLKKAEPVSLDDAAGALSAQANVSTEQARTALEKFFLESQNVKDEKGRLYFPFKLHQFISGAGKVLCELKPQGERFITLDAQRYSPKTEGALLYSVYFCRECGQEFMPVENSDGKWEPREIDSPILKDTEQTAGFLVPKTGALKYQDENDLPDFWLEDFHGQLRVKRDKERFVPQPKKINVLGEEDANGYDYYYIPGSIKFCPCCGIVHESQGKDINRLAGLSGEGRSSATTILTFTILNRLFAAAGVDNDADKCKLLGFTDNRQDAALQSGHFNDFIFLTILRGGLLGALQKAANGAAGGGLREEDLPEAVFSAIGFANDTPEALGEYLSKPEITGFAKADAQKALRYILGYRLLRDLRRGWRWNNPTLEQLGLIRIEYYHLSEYLAEANAKNDPALPDEIKCLPLEKQQGLFELIFNEMRGNLCIDSRFLSLNEQEKAKSNRDLKEPWNFPDDETLAQTRYLVFDTPPNRRDMRGETISGGPRSRIVRLIRRENFWQGTVFENADWTGVDYADIVRGILLWSEKYRYVKQFSDRWCLSSGSLLWRLCGEDENAEGVKTSQRNNFFRKLYLETAKALATPQHHLFDYESHEHTAQVEQDTRKLLERRFRYDKKAKENGLPRLPVLYCSPTMELGIDISSLDTVYMRNVPPTPANYAQRSGRAGRSGQAALVVTYCTALSPHDQWFFKHKEDMVYGKVKTPLFDLSNKDLIDSHLHSIWLQSMGVELDASIKNVLDLGAPGMPVQKYYADKLQNSEAMSVAVEQAKAICAELQVSIGDSLDWLTDAYVENIFDTVFGDFEAAFARWRELYSATTEQMENAHKISISPGSSKNERDDAQRRYNDAKRQLDVLLSEARQSSDFYTYRYLASSGFLPGYNFPRLPLMAWIPSRGVLASGDIDQGTMIARQRFLGISEFGPNSIIYHEGRMYRVRKAKLNSAQGQVSATAKLPTKIVKICPECGHGHYDQKLERCVLCDTPLDAKTVVDNLYKIETVETTQTERISINDEERQKIGYDLQTMFEVNKNDMRESVISCNGDDFGLLRYVPAAKITRVNFGWRRRANKQIKGFNIDPLSGLWEKNPDSEEQDANPAKRPPQRIVPYVEDTKNILIFKPNGKYGNEEIMPTLQAALKRGIETYYELEESEIAAEPLPSSEKRNSILFYEASEGGAGVLRRLTDDPRELSRIAKKTLEIMHYHIESDGTLTDEKNGPEPEKICVSACYDCLLSYYNQPEHPLINRRNKAVLEILKALAEGTIVPQTEENAGKNSNQSVAFNNGKYTPDEYYHDERKVIFYRDIDDEAKNWFEERGFVVEIKKQGGAR